MSETVSAEGLHDLRNKVHNQLARLYARQLALQREARELAVKIEELHARIDLVRDQLAEIPGIAEEGLCAPAPLTSEASPP